MTIARNLTGTGLSGLAAQAIVGNVGDGLVATGTTQATALLLSNDLNIFSTVASSTGCILPNGAENDKYAVVNGGASSLTIYPPVGGTLAGAAVNTGYTLAAASSISFTFTAALTAIVSPGDGAASALSFSALTYTTAGTLTEEPFIILGAPAPPQIGGVVSANTGKWAQLIGLSSVNDRLTSITFTDLQGITNQLSISTIPALITLSFPALVCVGGTANFNPATLASLTTLSAPLLEEVSGNFTPSTMALLTTFTITNLKKADNFVPTTMAALTTLSAPALTAVRTSFAPTTMAALTTFNFPALATVGTTFAPTTMASLTSMSLPALTDVYGAPTVGISILSMASLTTISFGALVRVGAGNTSGNAFLMNSGTAAVTSLTINSAIKQVGSTTGNFGNVVISSAALDVTSVNNLLVTLAGLDGTNGTTAFSSRTVTITGTSAAPTGAGAAAVITLTARGCTVTTN